MIVHKLSKYLISIPLILIAIALIGAKHIKSLGVDITNEALIGLGITFLFAAFLYIDNRLSDLIKRPSVGLITDNLNNCMRIVEERMNHVKNLRILANNTLYVYPAISNSQLTVRDCKLLVRKVSTEGKGKGFQFNATIANMVSEWKSLEKKKKITTLTAKSYEAVPTEWQIIFDNKFLIKGLCYPIGDNWKDVELLIDNVTLIENVGKETDKIFKLYISRFDNYFKEAQNIN